MEILPQFGAPALRRLVPLTWDSLRWSRRCQAALRRLGIKMARVSPYKLRFATSDLRRDQPKSGRVPSRPKMSSQPHVASGGGRCVAWPGLFTRCNGLFTSVRVRCTPQYGGGVAGGKPGFKKTILLRTIFNADWTPTVRRIVYKVLCRPSELKIYPKKSSAQAFIHQFTSKKMDLRGIYLAKISPDPAPACELAKLCKLIIESSSMFPFPASSGPSNARSWASRPWW